MPTGWKLSKIQESATSCVTVTYQIKDLAADMKTELISLQNYTFALRMSRFTDMAQLASATATLQRVFLLWECSATNTSSDKYAEGWITFLTPLVFLKQLCFHLHCWRGSDGGENFQHHNVNRGSGTELC